ncbi:MAG: methylenetetrahydrofolate reductase C-terminal domain-containing protein [Victivallaceae bacterium]|nr:methylenetetrahydrofolate reductase C-terminal domain-containing protein [Victivallaceae bacterium]
MNANQLKIQFGASEHVNHFKEALDHGEFVLLLECVSPGGDVAPETAGELLAALHRSVAEAAEEFHQKSFLAVTDCDDPLGMRSVDYLLRLPPEEAADHVAYLSGAQGDARVKEQIDLAAASGIVNCVCVTGNPAPGETLRQIRKREFSESVEQLHYLTGKGGAFHAGCVVNPFLYSAWSLYPQFFKMMKKIHAGAQFVVTQAGWDMVRLQTLRWYLAERSCFVPTVARLMFLTPERVEEIRAGHMPGIRISDDFQGILDKELRFSRAQFEAAQWRRIELQAAGCRLLGYSAVQLGGVTTSAQAKYAVERIAAALREFQNFDQWLEAYNSYLAVAEMPPDSESFFLYDRTLQRAYPDELAPPRRNEPKLPQIGVLEKFFWQVKEVLFRHASSRPASSRMLLKFLLAGCRNCEFCTLGETMEICVMHCPEKLRNGPCGGVLPDGSCCFQNGKCVHDQIMRTACWRNRVPELEDDLFLRGESPDENNTPQGKVK